MGEIISIVLLMLLPLAIAGGGPFLLRPISQGSKGKGLASFALIDLAALIWLLSLVPLLLRMLHTYITLVANQTDRDFIYKLERGYWFIATMLGLILTAIWASGVRGLATHKIRSWKARASYLGIAIPLAYLCPACVLISVVSIILDRQLRGFWGVLLILFSLLTGVISRSICLLVMRTSALQQKEPVATAPASLSDPFSETKASCESSLPDDLPQCKSDPHGT